MAGFEVIIYGRFWVIAEALPHAKSTVRCGLHRSESRHQRCARPAENGQSLPGEGKAAVCSRLQSIGTSTSSIAHFLRGYCQFLHTFLSP